MALPTMRSESASSLPASCGRRSSKSRSGADAASMQLPTVAIRAHAKINLDLRVLGPRPDGYHELRTVFQSIALHDVIQCVARVGPLAIECAAAGVPLD